METDTFGVLVENAVPGAGTDYNIILALMAMLIVYALVDKVLPKLMDRRKNGDGEAARNVTPSWVQSIFDLLRTIKDDGKASRHSIETTESWLGPNQEGVQTWRGQEVVKALRENTTVLGKMADEHTSQTKVLGELVHEIRIDRASRNAHPCKPAPPPGGD